MNNVYNTAVGESTTIMELFELIKSFLEKYDKNISNIKPIFGNIREGDVPHSLASIDKAKYFLDYNPTSFINDGLKESIDWYYNRLK